MSRAFVKETSESAPPPERMVADGPKLVTQAGYERIVGEVARLEGALKALAIRLRSDGATAGQDVLLRETLERDLRYWNDAKARAEIVPKPEGDAVAFGSRVTVARNGRTQSFHIVGEDEADPPRGAVSFRSPLAQALIGARKGDVVEMEKPAAEIEILGIEN
jgi:transcription elongation GreA/GreB family factor